MCIRDRLCAAGKGFFRWLARHPKLLILFILVVAIAVGGPFFWLAIRDRMSIYSDTSKLGFEDIGEMATQSAYCTEISMTEADREFFGISIPFTQSKYIYSYDVEIKAGYDFGKIQWSVDEETKTIEVKLPEAQDVYKRQVQPCNKIARLHRFFELFLLWAYQNLNCSCLFLFREI